MAKQGFFKFERTFGCFIFYRVGDRYYIRQKSRLSGRRVKTGKAFANSRASARRLAIGSCVAASVYRQLPEAWKMYELYQKLTGLAIRLQKEGKSVTEFRPLLEKQLYDWGYRREINYPAIKPSPKPIIIRSAKECKAAEAAHQTKQEKQPITLSKKRRIKKLSSWYKIRRIRKPAIFSAPACNRSYQYAEPLVSLYSIRTLRPKPPYTFSVCISRLTFHVSSLTFRIADYRM